MILLCLKTVKITHSNPITKRHDGYDFKVKLRQIDTIIFEEKKMNSSLSMRSIPPKLSYNFQSIETKS